MIATDASADPFALARAREAVDEPSAESSLLPRLHREWSALRDESERLSAAIDAQEETMPPRCARRGKTAFFSDAEIGRFADGFPWPEVGARWRTTLTAELREAERIYDEEAQRRGLPATLDQYRAVNRSIAAIESRMMAAPAQTALDLKVKLDVAIENGLLDPGADLWDNPWKDARVVLRDLERLAPEIEFSSLRRMELSDAALADPAKGD